jgi:Ser/Thr protein kinase RdoA (MazF antagonist)
MARVLSVLLRPARWLWARIKGEHEQRQTWLVEIVDAMGTAVANVDKMGRGSGWDTRWHGYAVQAETVIAGRAALVADEELERRLSALRETLHAALERPTNENKRLLWQRYDHALAAISKRGSKSPKASA